MQFVLVVLEIFITRRIVPGDNYYGSLKDAHEFGVWLLFMITFMGYHLKSSNSIRKSITLCTTFACLLMLYLADAKHVVLAYLMGLFLYSILYIIKIKKKIIAAIVLFSIVAFYIGIFTLESPFVKQFIEQNSNGFSIYLYDNNYNYKYHYFYGTISEDLTGIHFLTGYGLGKYGSRGANLFAYNIMYRNQNALNRFIEAHFSPFYINEYKKYAEVYTDNLVQNIKWRSAVLTYPFSSFLAFIAENGIIGVFCWSIITSCLFKNSNRKLLFSFFVMVCLFDLYIDRINVIGTLIILLSAKNKDSRVNEKNSFYNAFSPSRRC